MYIAFKYDNSGYNEKTDKIEKTSEPKISLMIECDTIINGLDDIDSLIDDLVSKRKLIQKFIDGKEIIHTIV